MVYFFHIICMRVYIYTYTWYMCIYTFVFYFVWICSMGYQPHRLVMSPGTLAAESSGWPSTWSTCRLEMLKKSKGGASAWNFLGPKVSSKIVRFKWGNHRKPLVLGVLQGSEIPTCLALQLSHVNRTACDSTMVSERMCVKLSRSNRHSVVHCWVSTIIAG